MGKQERERKARQKARRDANGGVEAGAGSEAAGDAQPSTTSVALFTENPSPGEHLADARLVGRAIRERWQSTDEKRRAIREKLQRVILDPKTNDPDTIAKLVTCDARLEAQNQRDDLSYDPFTGIPPGATGVGPSGDGDAAGTAVEVTRQVRFYIPSNGRGPEPVIVESPNNVAPKRPARKRKPAGPAAG